MGIWQTQLGPVGDRDAGGQPAGRCIGEIYCPICRNVLARLFHDERGIAVRARVPATAPGSPDTRGLAWICFGVVEASTFDAEKEVLHCWRGHHGLSFTASACRAIVAEYQRRGRKVMRPATV
jgi:hypothetical protein